MKRQSCLTLCHMIIRTGLFAQRVVRWLVSVAFLVYVHHVALAEGPSFGPKKVIKVGDKVEYSFFVREYEKALIFTPGRYDPGAVTPYSEPDVIVIKMLTQQARGLVDEYYSFFSDEFKQTEYEELRLHNDEAKAAISDDWRKRWVGKDVQLTHRVDFNIRTIRHAIIRYKVLEKMGQTGQVALSRRFNEGGFQWLVVNLQSHPLYNNWFFDGDKRILRRKRIYGQYTECEWASGNECIQAR